MDTRLADAMRCSRQDLDKSIRYARAAMRRGEREAEFLSAYIAEMRRSEGLRLAGEVFGLTGELWAPVMPMPICPGVVGLTPEEKFRREWLLETAPMAHRKAA